MSDQIRAFVAVDIPDDMRARIDPILGDLREMGSIVRPVRPENLHFTVKFLGNVPSSILESVKSVLDECRPLLGFEVTVRGLGAFPNPRRPRVIWLGSESEDEKMVALLRDVDHRLSKIGFKKERSYVPHLTLARLKGRPGPSLVAFLEKMQDVEVGSFRVASLKLKRSTLTPQGPIYSDLYEVSEGA